jgi:hypothetical protein
VVSELSAELGRVRTRKRIPRDDAGG